MTTAIGIQHYSSSRKIAFLLFLLLTYVSLPSMNAQKVGLGKKARKAAASLPTAIDTSSTPLQDTLLLPPIDTVDLGVVDSLAPTPSTAGLPRIVRYSKDSLDAAVSYKAVDSMLYDIKNSLVYLYGNAEVTYEDMKIKADYIEFDWNSNIALAQVRYDSLGLPIGNVTFEDPTNNFEAQKMRYNFKTQKGKVYDVRTKEGDGYLLSQGVKFDLKSNTDKNEDDVIYADGTLYTTCDLPHPHFGIKSAKAKIIPNKLIVVGPSNLVISDVPTPLWLPFGFFPITKGRRSGLIFPKDYEFSPVLGYGFRNVGYYWGGSDYMDLSLTGDIYTRGSWGLSASSAYRKRYKHSGNVTLSASRRIIGQRNTPDFSSQFDVNLRWSHSQDNKAHPSRSFSASMNIGTGSYQTNNYNDSESVLNNTLSSNVSFRKTWPGKPFTFSSNLTHSQNLNTGTFSVTFPDLNFTVQTIFPFKRKKALGKEQWYEKINVSYTSRLQNRLNTIDSLLFGGEVDFLNDMRYGWEHRVPVSANFRLFKYFNLSPSVSFTSKWHLQNTEKQYLRHTFTKLDTIYNPVDSTILGIEEISISEGLLLDYQRYGFSTQNELRASLSLSTKLFGLLKFRFKNLKAIRHQVSPSISMSFTPDYEKWGYFRDVTIEAEDPEDVVVQSYSIFENNSIYGQPTRNRTASLNWRFGNILEAKVLNRKDSTKSTKKIKIIESFNINGSYNFAADSIRHSNISMNGRSTLFKVLSLNYGATFSPYNFEEGRIRKESNLAVNGRLLNFRGGQLSSNISIRPDDLAGLFGGKKKNKGRQIIGALTFNYVINIGKVYAPEEEIEKIMLTRHSIGLSRTSINITRFWRIGIGNIGYDFLNKSITYPDFSFYRDLHCWEMGVDTQPTRGTFSFFLRVKPGSLDFLSIPYKRNRSDPFEF